MISVGSSEPWASGREAKDVLTQRHRAHREEKIDLQKQKTEKVSSVIFVGSSEAGVRKRGYLSQRRTPTSFGGPRSAHPPSPLRRSQGYGRPRRAEDRAEGSRGMPTDG